MKTKYLKILTAFVLSLTLFITASVPASAEAFSEWTEKKEYQYTYQFYAGMLVNPYGAYSTVYVQSKNGAPIMAGYVGIDPFLYASNGELKKTLHMRYNTAVSAFLQEYVSIQESGNYYAKGLVKFYTGQSDNGKPVYNLYHTESTPCQTYTANSVSPIAAYMKKDIEYGYSVNAKGETYGSGLCADIIGEYPDLISARGINGESGYVRFDDIDYQPSSLEDAIEYSENLEDTLIPVYDISGNIIDWFELSGDLTY